MEDGCEETIFPISSFCSDFSLWHDYCFEGDKAKNYTPARDCATYAPLLQNASKVTCSSKEEFYCSKSNSCVSESFVCDGSVNCLNGEDEDFDLCKSKSAFSESATVECLEANRTFINITILAIPCDGITGMYGSSILKSVFHDYLSWDVR